MSKHKQLAILAVCALLASTVLTAGSSQSTYAQNDTRTFPETGKTVRGRFLEYWNQNGELAQQGYPITEELREQSDTDGIARTTIRLIGSSLRITDHAWLEDGDVVILLPESDGATAAAFAERVRTAAPGRFTEQTGIAAFPDDGLTSEALLDALERRGRGADLPSPMVRTTVSAVADLVAAPAAAPDPVESGVG